MTQLVGDCPTQAMVGESAPDKYASLTINHGGRSITGQRSSMDGLYTDPQDATRKLSHIRGHFVIKTVAL